MHSTVNSFTDAMDLAFMDDSRQVMAFHETPEDIIDRRALKRTRSSYEKPVSLLQSGNVLVEDQPELFSKRFPQDLLGYQRRRAIIACEICRSRKSRCDGGRPKCRLCTELCAECVYREPGVKLDAGDKLILEQLARIEHILTSNLNSPVTQTGPISPATSNTASDDFVTKHARTVQASTATSAAHLNAVGIWSANISAMPKSHTTPALHLLQCPVIRDLISQQCDPQILMQLELAREPLDLDHQHPVDFLKAGSLAQNFFDQANVWYAVVSPYTWHQTYQAAASVDFRTGPESCIVLLVLALGEAACSGHSISRLPHGHRPLGTDYFAKAWHILPSLMIKNDVLSVQCHILAAAYLLYLVRPLEAWNLLCNASMKHQLLLASPDAISPEMRRLSERIYWNIMLIESDLLAELHLPHSGIVQFEESTQLPRSFLPDTDTLAGNDFPGNDDIWYLLAEIALRRLLNRVSHLVYTHRSSSTFTLASLELLVPELESQLLQWYDSLPGPLRFPKEDIPAQDAAQTVLRLRYFACRTIIFRPYVQAVLADENLAHEPGVQDACRKCLEACIRQLKPISAHCDGHLPYLWQGALSIVSQTLLLMGATLTPALAAMLPPTDQVDTIIAEAVTEVEQLAHLAPSLQLCAEIVGEAERRRQILI